MSFIIEATTGGHHGGHHGGTVIMADITAAIMAGTHGGHAVADTLLDY